MPTQPILDVFNHILFVYRLGNISAHACAQLLFCMMRYQYVKLKLCTLILYLKKLCTFLDIFQLPLLKNINVFARRQIKHMLLEFLFFLISEEAFGTPFTLIR